MLIALWACLLINCSNALIQHSKAIEIRIGILIEILKKRNRNFLISPSCNDVIINGYYLCTLLQSLEGMDHEDAVKVLKDAQGIVLSH